MSDLVPQSRQPLGASRLTPTRQDRRLARELVEVESKTIVRIAQVQSEGLIHTEKLREVDRLAREAMTGHVMLVAWSNHLAGESPVLVDELRFFTEMARLGKGELLADSIETFRKV